MGVNFDGQISSPGKVENFSDLFRARGTKKSFNMHVRHDIA